MHKRAWTAILLLSALTLLAIVGVACWPDAQSRQVPESDFFAERGLLPAGTPTPAGYRPGLAVWQDLGATVTRTAGQQVDSVWEIYVSQRQADATVTPNFSTDATRVAYLASLGAQTWLGMNFFEEVPTEGTPDTIYLPSGVPTVTYYTTPAVCKNYAPDYSSQVFLDWYEAFVVSMTDAFDSNANVAGYIITVGPSLETVNVVGGDYGIPGEVCDDGQTEFETVVGYQDYLDFVEFAMQTWRANTTKALYISNREGMIYPDYGWESARRIAGWSYPLYAQSPDATSTPMWIGTMNRALQQSNFDSVQSNGWGVMEGTLKMSEVGGSGYMTGYNASTYADTTILPAMLNNMVFGALAYGADNIFVYAPWLPYLSTEARDVLDATIGTTLADSPMAFSVMRNAEFRRIYFAYDVTWLNDIEGNLEYGLQMVQTTPTPACIGAVATQIAGSAGATPPAVCAQIVGTPGPSQGRNFNYFASNAIIRLAVDPDWQFANLAADFPYTLTVHYLNVGTDPWTVNWQDVDGTPAAQTITNTNTLAWATAVVPITSDMQNGNYTANSTPYALEIRTTGTPDAFYAFILESDTGETPTPPTATPTPTASPTSTKTPTPTATAAATAIPTVVLNEVCPNVTIDTNLDGQVELGDRYVELYSGDSANAWLYDWTLTIGSDIYTLQWTTLISNEHKAIFGRDLGFTIPVTGTVTLNAPDGTQMDTVTWTAQSANQCYGRSPTGTGSWSSGLAITPGRANP